MLYPVLLWTVLCLVNEVCSWDAVDWNAHGQHELDAALRTKPNLNIARNVILFIGDGMGVSTVTAARIYQGQLQGRAGEEGKLSFETFPHVALSKTYNVNHQVADSAGTATAFLCGVKTRYGIIGLNQDAIFNNCSSEAGGQVKSILHWSKTEGKSTGIVTNTRLTHATPAASYAHSASRWWEVDEKVPDEDRNICEDIASQLINNNDINVMLGGGRKYFLPNTEYDPEYQNVTGARLDGQNLLQDWQIKKKSQGDAYAYVWNKTAFDRVDPARTDYLMGMFEPNHMKYEIYRDLDTAGEPSLSEMTEKAIKILNKNRNGYFLLVEGGRIDHGHHDGTAKKALVETVAFSDAVATAMKLTNQDETLIVVTADHSHVFTIGGYPSRGNDILGLNDMAEEQPPLDDMPHLTLAYANGPGAGRHNLTGWDLDDPEFRQESLVPMKMETHGGEDVAIYAQGPMGHLFHGVHEQNYIAHAMAYASCVGANQNHCYNANSLSQQQRANTFLAGFVVLLFIVNTLN